MASARVERFFKERMVSNYDRLMRPFERRVFGEARARLVPLAEGRVLEIGAGTGVNFAYYGARARLVVATDPEPGMLRQAAARIAGRRVVLVAAAAESLPFPDATFDCAVATLVLCTVRRPLEALSELRRVLRPGGRAFMLEHVRARVPALAAAQDVLTPVQRVVAAGCHLNRPTQLLVERAGLTLGAVRERFASTVVEIEAVRAS